jgi:hypothetical protein
VARSTPVQRHRLIGEEGVAAQTMVRSRVPELDDELRRRLGRRFGSGIGTWLDGLPPVLADLSGRWRIDFEALIQRGSMSVVIRCRRRTPGCAEGQPGPETGLGGSRRAGKVEDG